MNTKEVNLQTFGYVFFANLAEALEVQQPAPHLHRCQWLTIPLCPLPLPLGCTSLSLSPYMERIVDSLIETVDSAEGIEYQKATSYVEEEIGEAPAIGDVDSDEEEGVVLMGERCYHS